MRPLCKIFLFSALVLVPGIFGCQKKSDPEPAQPSKTDHIAASTWKVEDIGPDQNRDGRIDGSVLSFFACLQDNTIAFRKDNSGTTDEGAVKCNAGDPQTSTINWAFADAESSIVVSNSGFGSINGKSKILELNATALALTKDTLFMGTNTAFIVKLKH